MVWFRHYLIYSSPPHTHRQTDRVTHDTYTENKILTKAGTIVSVLFSSTYHIIVTNQVNIHVRFILHVYTLNLITERKKFQHFSTKYVLAGRMGGIIYLVCAFMKNSSSSQVTGHENLYFCLKQGREHLVSLPDHFNT